MRNAPAVQRYYKPDELVQYSVVISKYCKVQRGLCDFQPVTKLSCKHCWQHTNKVSISWQENKNIHRDSLCVGWSSWNANSPCRFENSISPLHGFSSNDDDSELRPMWSFSSPVQFLLEIVSTDQGYTGVPMMLKSARGQSPHVEGYHMMKYHHLPLHTLTLSGLQGRVARN